MLHDAIKSSGFLVLSLHQTSISSPMAPFVTFFRASFISLDFEHITAKGKVVLCISYQREHPFGIICCDWITLISSYS